MHTELIICKYCENKISYKSEVDFIVFCSICLKAVHLECENGCGSVTPCTISLVAILLGKFCVTMKGIIH